MNNKDPQPNTSPLKDKVLASIERDCVAPRTRYMFLLRELLFWVLCILTVLVGAIAVAATLFVVTHSGWEYYELVHSNFFSFILSVLPVMWILLGAAMIALAYFDIRHMKHGYRYPLVTIVLGVAASSILGGIVLYVYGFGEIFEEDLGKHVPFHVPVMMHQEGLWHAPEEGRLLGVLEAATATRMTVIDRMGDVWVLDTHVLNRDQVAHLEVGNHVRLVGYATSSGTVFVPCAVLPDIRAGKGAGMGVFERRKEFMEQFLSEGESGEIKPPSVRSKGCEGVRARVELHSN